MTFLLWLERNFAWIRLDGWFRRPIVEPVLPRILATGRSVRMSSDPGESFRARHTILLNLATSVGGAVIIGVLSGIATAERVGQRVTDTLNNHEQRIVVIEANYVPAKVHAEKDEKVKAEFDAVTQRESETRAQMLTLQSEFNQFLLQQREGNR